MMMLSSSSPSLRPGSTRFGLTSASPPKQISSPPLSTFILRLSSSSSPSIAQDKDESQTQSQTSSVLSGGGCKACGKEETEAGCNGEGRVQGGIAMIPGFGWWPIKAYRPCPAFVASGGSYKRSGQTLDQVIGSGRLDTPPAAPSSSKEKRQVKQVSE